MMMTMMVMMMTMIWYLMNIQCQKVRVMMSECIPYFGQCILLVLKSLECLFTFILAGCILLEFSKLWYINLWSILIQVYNFILIKTFFHEICIDKFCFIIVMTVITVIIKMLVLVSAMLNSVWTISQRNSSPLKTWFYLKSICKDKKEIRQYWHLFWIWQQIIIYR